jgi:8-hydroxy-5-deazaflavin:NADPH oxidoreductase
MRIGIIGSGEIGGTLATLLAADGHEIALSNSRGPDTLTIAVAQLGEHAQATTALEAADFGEIVIIAIPYGRYHQLPVDVLAGRVVVDTMNYFAERDGVIDDLVVGDKASSELLADFVKQSTVVKAFNTMHYLALRDRGLPRGAIDRLASPIAGDDRDAKTQIGQLIDELGFDPLDTGSLGESDIHQGPASQLFGQLLAVEEADKALGRGDIPSSASS